MGTAGKSIADFFAGAYIVGKLENHHTGVCFYSDFQISQSVTSGRAKRFHLLQIETEADVRTNISICNSKTTFIGLNVTD